MKPDDDNSLPFEIGAPPTPTSPVPTSLATTLPATESALLSRSAQTIRDVPPPIGITGNDLASFALDHSARELSTLGLNTIGLALLQEAVKTGDLRACASIFSTIEKANSKARSAPSKGGRRTVDEATTRALARASQARAVPPPSKRTLDVESE